MNTRKHKDLDIVEEVVAAEQPVSERRTTLFFDEFLPVLAAIFEQHGGRLENHGTYCLATFPPGTTRAEILYRVRDPRFWITFPDGYRIQEDAMRSIEASRLRFLAADIPEHLHELCRSLGGGRRTETHKKLH